MSLVLCKASSTILAKSNVELDSIVLKKMSGSVKLYLTRGLRRYVAFTNFNGATSNDAIGITLKVKITYHLPYYSKIKAR
jgi:hypothetical protein